MSIKSKLVIVSHLLQQSTEHFRHQRYKAAYSCYEIECEILAKPAATYEEWHSWMASFVTAA